MKNIIFILALFVYSILNVLFADEPAYITDSLQLRLFKEPSEKSEIIQTMQSGESVEVIETKGAYSRVRTYDNIVGWVKSAFLVTETPPTLLYYAVSEENKELKQELEQLKKNNMSSDDSDKEAIEHSITSKITQLKQDLQQQREENKQLQKELAEFRDKNIFSTGEIKPKTTTFNKFAYQTSSLALEKVLYLFAGLLLFLVFGIVLGARFSSRRIRKRLHGFTLE